MNLYSNKSSSPVDNAQRNLMGRTHYVDPDVLRFHKSRVLSARHAANGLLFAIVTSDALDMRGRRRGFRYAIFDLFGKVLDRPTLEDAFKSSEKATAAMWKALAAIDAKQVTLDAIASDRLHHNKDLDQLAETVVKL